MDQTSSATPRAVERGSHWPTSGCRGLLRSCAARKFAVFFFSDVSGAFDRVRAERLLEKLRCKGVHPVMIALAGSRLQQRTAQVVVEGSDGTVLGPPSGTSSTRMPDTLSTRQDSWKSSTQKESHAVQTRTKTRSCIAPLGETPRNRKAGACFTDLFSNMAQDTLRTCFSPLRRWPHRNTANISVRSVVSAICRCWPTLFWVSQMSTICFLHGLLLRLKCRVMNGDDCWHHTFAPCVPMPERPLRHFS